MVNHVNDNFIFLSINLLILFERLGSFVLPTLKKDDDKVGNNTENKKKERRARTKNRNRFAKQSKHTRDNRFVGKYALIVAKLISSYSQCN